MAEALVKSRLEHGQGHSSTSPSSIVAEQSADENTQRVARVFAAAQNATLTRKPFTSAQHKSYRFMLRFMPAADMTDRVLYRQDESEKTQGLLMAARERG